jgi:type II secretion system (T2SS) protein M
MALRTTAAAVGAALCAFAALWALARADHQGERLASLNAVAAKASTPTGAAAPAAAPCREPLEAATAQTTQALRSASAAAGLSLETLEFQPLADPPADLRGLRFAMGVRGPEAAVAGFVRTVAAQGLPLFLDGADLRRGAGGAVQADFNGRLLCRRGLG